MLTTLSIIWVVVTVILVLLSIHRSILVMREEDTIFLSEAEASMRDHYAEILRRLRRLELVLKIFTFASGGLMLLIAVLWAYQGLYP
jgi:predicted ABC-type exoprotein transport system permease subunit